MDSEENKIETKKRHGGVLLEDLDSKLDILVEGQVALDTKIDRHYEEFREFVSDAKFKFGVVFEKFEEMDDKFEIVFEELHELRKERVA
jgi:hypothetical protein